MRGVYCQDVYRAFEGKALTDNTPGDSTMQADVLFRILKGVSWAVIALMLISILYAGFTSIKYWSGIGV